ncbi:TROVE domain-containing protein [Larkinella harenae]
MRLNVKTNNTNKTHEGGKAATINPEQQLRRSVLSCLLWENGFYEDGQTIADRIVSEAQNVPEAKVHALATEARTKYNLRHVPLLLLATKPNAQAIYNTINRADELAELLAVYWRNGRKSIPAQMKKGLAKAFTKFSEYQLAKYNRDGAIKLRDVLFMVHAKPKDAEQDQVWKKLVDGTLVAPDTWEVALSGGADKRETFERLLREEKLGYLALLRNLRNMIQSNVNSDLVRSALLARKGADKVLPFRFIAADRHAPQYEPEIDTAMMDAIKALPTLKGKTAVLIDVSGSMDAQLSAKSDMTRLDAAAGLGAIVQSDTLRVFSFSESVVEVPPRRGMAGVDAIIKSQSHLGTYLKKAIQVLGEVMPDYDRLIVITDEQSHDGACDPLPTAKGYLINVASNKNGIGYGRWVHIDGFSENVIRFIHEYENQD